MILLFGGTSESSMIAAALADAGCEVLVCTATDEPMAIDKMDGVSRRCGRLDTDGMIQLIRSRRPTAVVDATHPYALGVRDEVRQAVETERVRFFSYLRPSAVGEEDGVDFVSSHEEAADLAFSFGCPVLLTTGSNNIEPYAQKASETELSFTIRVLDRPESIAACKDTGQVIAAKGPFSLEENIEHIRIANAGVLVAKDSGTEGGLPARIMAAKQTGCKVIVIRRQNESGEYEDNLETLIEKLKSIELIRKDGI